MVTEGRLWFSVLCIWKKFSLNCLLFTFSCSYEFFNRTMHFSAYYDGFDIIYGNSLDAWGLVTNLTKYLDSIKTKNAVFV